ncbi:MAG: type III PLP-dependent enzyme [Alphaproteobacteria bacterium]|nr:type III PLP-dependent enzyme [Alphaproteobacteria bacterium]MBU0797622.1 type III PLP-dependent enzyme [Alphaproteobacteria bacterium]MBU0889132.1 type III PLP-dependent enzyme [Alphaproteobacteria bacterium]MBU1812166.1 type III PLP-dependent enzyme [Alphaproteobacteria bacterium]MBU2090179.1 type III PLP-dependent enzyme [Alphaproteobacteria bacterium]
MNEKIARFLAERRVETPFLVVDLDVVEENYRALTAALPDAKVFYAVKANPAPQILHRLNDLGSSFDTASVVEIQDALAAGATPERISYGNTIKKQSDIAKAHALGVNLFAFDSEAELRKIAEAAPGARVFCRILTSGEGADWPLSRKFGCEPSMAFDLLLKAADMGVVPYGISFHVGSQQRDPMQWDAAIAATAKLFQDLEHRGIMLRMVNLGGGFPTRYQKDMPTPAEYGNAIAESMRAHFGNRIPETIVEPGRGMVGNAGVIESEVVLISRKSENDPKRWVYLDIGKFGGLAETMDEAIKYPLGFDRELTAEGEAVVLAGPTCDSADVMYEKEEYKLPLDLAIGDRIRIGSTGAYTTTYSAVAFNGFKPLASYYI